MKAQNLQFLQDHGIRVPAFTVVTDPGAIHWSFSTAEKFAVRSTFDGEDSGEASFAGQFDTLLNVPRDDVPAAVKRVRASYGKANVEEYKAARGMEENTSDDVSSPDAAPVLVQEMVDADLAGVLFTANPTGLLNEAVVVVGEGLGDAVVEDRADTTTYYYNKDDDLYYFEKTGDSPELPADCLTELVETAKKVEELYGKPMDMEYAIADGTVYFLQARPITTLGGEKTTVLDSSNIVESYPGLTLPLSQSFAKDIYYEIFKALLNRATKNSPVVEDIDAALKDMVVGCNGRVYYRITSWYDVLSLMPFSKKFIAIWQDMLGVEHKAVDTDISAGVGTKATMLTTVLHYLRTTPQEMDNLNEFYKEYSKNLREDLERIASLDETASVSSEVGAAELLKIRSLLKKYHALKGDIIPRWDITLINDMYAFIYTALAGERNKAQLSNLSNLESMKPANAMNALADVARTFGMESSEYESAKEGFIEAFGDRCLGELKLETRTYRTNPELVDAYVERLNKRAAEDESDTGEPRYKKSATPEVPPTTRNPNVRKAKVGIKNREISRMNRTRIYGFGRTIFTEIGKALYALDLLDTPEDVFYLYIHELEAFAFGDAQPDFRTVVDERKRDYEGYAKLPAYTRLVFDGRVRNKQVRSLQTDSLERKSELTGLGASLGTAVGEALVVETPDVTLDTTGKILVTHSTDPGWVFLIQNAEGIVAEKGSLLSHTAIITRELGKPAVVGVKDATRLIKTGDRVEVDADRGIVRLLSE